MRNTAFILFLILLPTVTFAAGASNILDVGKNSDATPLAQFQIDLSTKIMDPCKKQIIRSMMQKGQNSTQILNAMTTVGSNAATEKQCLCKSKPTLASQVNNLNGILTRHPEWSGKVLLVQMPDNSQMSFDPAALKSTQTTLGQCSAI